jgi:2-dehydro-3-deoxyphosphogluconate aldolase/(4S)-4-hydroxy-2-oxoglutarate aldolase
LEKAAVLNKITGCGVVAVVRAENAEQAVKIAAACMKAGIAGIEIAFTVPGAIDVIKQLVEIHSEGEFVIGAGTVLDTETARAAMLAGAQYIVSPCLNQEVVTMCNRYQIPCIPGAMTIREVVEGMEAGAEVIKIFPGELFGPAFIKAVKGPIPCAKLMPTGGVGLENVAEWIKAGAVAVGIGGNLTAGAKTGDYASITAIGKQFMKKVKSARQALEQYTKS